MNAPTLRPYQVAAVDAARERYRAGDRSTLVLLPTGCGKTVVFADVARRVVERPSVDRPRRVLVLAHRSELLDQAARKLTAAGVDAAIEQAGRRAGGAPVVVASVQTLKGKRLASWPADTFDLVIVDEAHHATAQSYRTILDHFAPAKVLGVTATGDRADGRGLGEVFQSVAYRYELRKAIADGWLVPIRAKRVKVAVDLDAVETARGDLHNGQLADIMSAGDAVEGVVGPLLELAGDRPTILFAVDVAHAAALAAGLNERRPGSAVAVSGESPEADRRQAAADLAARRVQFGVNCQLWTEGFDLPDVACVALARPTKSRALFVQMIGRGTRLADGKADLVVLDFTGNTKRHRLVSAVDVLADRGLTDEERGIAEGMIEADYAVDVIDAVEQAKQEAEVQLKAKTLSWVYEEVGSLLDLVPEPERPYLDAPATLAQRSALENAGMKPPAALTKSEASRILDAIAKRRRDGLCTYKQARWLKQQGVDASRMTFEEANEAITQAHKEFKRWA